MYVYQFSFYFHHRISPYCFRPTSKLPVKYKELEDIQLEKEGSGSIIDKITAVSLYIDSELPLIWTPEM